MGYIYKITNIVTNKCYIGQTINDPEKRWMDHKKTINTKYGCPALKASMKKHGIEHFKFEVLIICFDSDMSKFEKEYIKKFESFGPKGYNLTHGGEEGGFFKGCKHTPEEVERIKERLKLWRENPENLKKHADKIRKNFQDPEYKKRHSEIMKKVAAVRTKVCNKAPASEETKRKIRESVLRYYNNNQSNNEYCEDRKAKHSEIMSKVNGRKINQFTLDGKFVGSYDTIKKAGLDNKLSYKAIAHNLAGRSKQSQGFIWKYAD